MDWKFAPDVKLRLDRLLKSNLFPHISATKITALRGYGSTGRAIARIWSLPRPWQLALKISPQYIIEVIAERFDKMSPEDQDRTLIHELMHIPKTFSGALVSHRGRYHRIDHKTVEKIYENITSARR
ncbi:metallopeptidase [Candidatus Microgenomates bacterium]|nr:metallopeptidase [Candidatus Microgenomates bacterium]